MPTPSAPQIVLASTNQGKLTELRALLAGAIPDLDVHTQVIDAATAGAPDVIEDGVSFQENSLKKAREIAAATGLIAIADDSGLVVDVMGGAPGIFSARWAGTHGDDQANLNLLLAQMADIAAEHRTARFVCAASIVTPDGTEIVETGTMEGSLTTAPRGKNGFGYDPILEIAGSSRTAAELSAAEKNKFSHRAKAFTALVPHLKDILNQPNS